MRETTRTRYRRLRRQRSHLYWQSIHQQRLAVGAGLLLAGLILLALIWRGATLPSSSTPLGAGADAPNPQGLQATALPVLTGSGVEQLQTREVMEDDEPALLFNTWRFTSEPGLDAEALQALLAGFPGVLKEYQLTIGERTHSIAEVLTSQSVLYGVNPKIVLAMMELQQSLLSDPDPEEEQLAWALNYRGEDGKMRGLAGQIRWVVRELRRGMRDYGFASELIFSDESRAPLPDNLDLGSYAVMRALARTTTHDQLQPLMDDFLAVYTRLFEDPRQPLSVELPPPAEPFLSYPLDRLSYITSFFDHEYPFLVQNGSLVSYWDRQESDISYDGHDGWDYGARPPAAILAAAPGTVLFAGNSDDGCGLPARGVVLDHGNGYRSLYWHMSSVSVEIGQAVDRGQMLGVVGATGCATGPHLHFQVQYLGRSTDPYGWCGDAQKDPWAVHPVGIVSRWLWLDKPDPCSPPQNALVVSAGGEGFEIEGAWEPVPVGVKGGSFWTQSLPPVPASIEISGTTVISDSSSPLSGVAVTATVEPELLEREKASATWRPRLPEAGRYQVLAYVPYFVNGLADASSVSYAIQHADGLSEVEINQQIVANDWADLGSYRFDPQQEAWVQLTNDTGEEDTAVWAGAMIWIPLGP